MCNIVYFILDTLATEGSVTIEYFSPIYAVPLRYDVAFDVYSGPPSNIDCIKLIEQVVFRAVGRIFEKRGQLQSISLHKQVITC